MSEINEAVEKIRIHSANLGEMATRMKNISTAIRELKRKLDIETENQKKDLRGKEQDGKLTQIDGRAVKLTDAVRESLARQNIIADFAEYESLKREADWLDSAIRAEMAAQSGQQTIVNVLQRELETLKYQP
jgi:hypothetical protein